MNIHSGVIVAAILVAIAAVFVVRASIRSMQSARQFSFYKAHKQRNASALRLFIFALLLFGCAALIPIYGEPLLYAYYPPSPTPSLTPTITLTPTLTLIPTVTGTPIITNTSSVTGTPTLTTTPFVPNAVEALFTGILTPNPESVFTEIQFSTKFDKGEAINPKTSFKLPITTMYGGFDYNFTIPDTQWTALWYRDGKLISFETKPWDGGTGGIGGYTECSNPDGGWQVGNYEVQIFMVHELRKVGHFVVLGNETATPTSTFPPPIYTATPTP